jgi:hypothetical protein
MFLIAFTAVWALAGQQTAEPVKFEITHVEEREPQIVRIFNLEEGTRVVVLPPRFVTVKSEKPSSELAQPIRIFNLEEGVREIAVPPTR